MMKKVNGFEAFSNGKGMAQEVKVLAWAIVYIVVYVTVRNK